MSNRFPGLDPVEPAEPIAAYFGGKRNLASRIISSIEAIPHRCYAEPFLGMGGVFLRRRNRPRSEFVNDVNGELVNLFRCVREHPEELGKQFDWVLSSRQEFCRLVETPPSVLTDIQRAARFAYLQSLIFGGIPANTATRGNYVSSPHHRAKLTTERMWSLIRRTHGRLQGVHIK